MDGDTTNWTLAGCGVDNGFGGFNRRHVRSGMDEVLDVVCFNTCSDCENVVTTDTNNFTCSTASSGILQTSFGVSPDPAMGETFLDGMLDESYLQRLAHLDSCQRSRHRLHVPTHVACGQHAGVGGLRRRGFGVLQGNSFSTDTVTQEQFFADEIGLEVLFNNNGDSGNPNAFLGGEQYCAAIEGAPNRSGIYRISIDIQAWATIFTPFNAPYTFDNFTLRVNCPLLEDVVVTNVNSDEGTQGTLTATLAEGVEASEVAWFNAFGDQIGTRMSVSVDNAGSFSVQITTADCQSLFGGWLVGDDALECELAASVDHQHRSRHVQRIGHGDRVWFCWGLDCQLV